MTGAPPNDDEPHLVYEESEDGKGLIIGSGVFSPELREALILAFDDAWGDDRTPPSACDMLRRMAVLVAAFAALCELDPRRVVIEVEDSDDIIGLGIKGPITDISLWRQLQLAKIAWTREITITDEPQEHHAELLAELDDDAIAQDPLDFES
jgi:hypothetical protein